MGAFCSACDGESSPPKTNTQRKKPTGYRSNKVIDASTTLDTVRSTDLAQLLRTPSLQDLSEDQAIGEFRSACTNSDDQLMMYLDEAFSGLDLLEVVWENGDTVLHVAVRNKNQKMMVYCLENGISVNLKFDYVPSELPNVKNSKSGNTALHLAAGNRDPWIVALLCKYGANSDVFNNSAATPLTIAEDNNDDDIIELLSPDAQLAFSISFRPEDRDGILQTPDKQHQAQSAVVKDMIGELTRLHTDVRSLPALKAFLEKKQSTVPYSWNMRWVIVRDSFMLWSDHQFKDVDTRNRKEMKQFSHINLLHVSEVKDYESDKKGRRFVMVLNGDKKGRKAKRSKEMHWRCETKDDRDYWVRNLKKYIESANAATTYVPLSAKGGAHKNM